MDESKVDVLDTVRSARPAVHGPEGETLARLRSTIFGAIVAPTAEIAPKFESPTAFEAVSTTAASPKDVGDEVAALVDVGGGRRPNWWRGVALVAAAALAVAGLTTVTLARRHAAPAVADGWTAPTADDFAPTSQFAVTRLLDGTTEVPFGASLTIGLIDPPPGAGIGCRAIALPAGVGSGSVVVREGRVVSWGPCNIVDQSLSSFLDGLMGAHPAVEIRGDELRLRAGNRELDALRPSTDPWLTPTVEQLSGSTYRVDRLVEGSADTPVGEVELRFGPSGFTITTSCAVATTEASIEGGELAMSAATVGSSMTGYRPLGSPSCMPLDTSRLFALLQAHPTIEARGAALRLRTDAAHVDATRTSASSAGAPHTPTMAELVGRTFVGDALTVNGANRPIVDSGISFTFGDGTVGARTGCNGLDGAASVESGHIRVVDLGGTQMACGLERQEQENTVGALLLAFPTISIVDVGGGQPATLVLAGGDVELRAHEGAVAALVTPTSSTGPTATAPPPGPGA